MNTSILSQVEKMVRQLQREEQLLLIERLAHRLRESREADHNVFEKELGAMAIDPEIQTILHKINEDFALTESDGL